MREGDSSTIRSLTVFTEDILDAFVYTRENPGTAVLRLTPPFHGRMRARLHVYHVDDTTATGAIHVKPDELLEDEIVDEYPTFATLEPHAESNDTKTTQDEGVAQPANATREANATRRAHAAAVDRWRTSARESIVESITLETDEGARRIAVKRLEQG